MRNDWSDEELKASVAMYLEMQQRERCGETVVKSAVYRELAERYKRTSKSFEYRMQNISYVLYLQGRKWLPGLLPAGHVGSKVAEQIERLLADLEERKDERTATQAIEVNQLIKKRMLIQPKGIKSPVIVTQYVTRYVRDPEVKAWILKHADGICESCRKRGPFIGFDGRPYLEVHHVRQLADHGSDRISNAVAVCPNSHRALHFSRKRFELVEELYRKVARLVRE